MTNPSNRAFEPALPVRMVLSPWTRRRRLMGRLAGRGVLLAVTSVAALALLAIIVFIAVNAMPFFRERGVVEFFTSRSWYPSDDPPQFGALPLFVGSALVAGAAMVVAVPVGIAAAVCLSDILPFGLRQTVKPVVEMLAAIPSVAYGFFALAVLAPLMQEHGARVLTLFWWLFLTPIWLLGGLVGAELATLRIRREGIRRVIHGGMLMLLLGGGLFVLISGHTGLSGIRISSGTNALTAAFILAIMALPTIVSVAEDALQAVGRELREGSFALGATRAETLVKIVIPSAASGIFSAILLGMMRAIGETMVVWMASGNAAQIPEPWYNLLQPVRTLTATIAGDMGEADQVTGSARYHVLFAMALCLLVFSLGCSLLGEKIVARQRRRLGGG